MSRTGRLLGNVLLWAALGLVIGAVLATGAPRLFGGTSLTVLSGSMEPAIHTGDVVVGRPIAASEARAGEVITFREPDSNRLVTHRLRRIRLRNGIAAMVTKGDANNAPERWRIPVGGRVSRVLYRVPRLGYARVFAGSPLGRLLLLVLPAFALAVFELKRIWRPAPAPGRHAARAS
jgi:signal peptidase